MLLCVLSCSSSAHCWLTYPVPERAMFVLISYSHLIQWCWVSLNLECIGQFFFFLSFWLPDLQNSPPSFFHPPFHICWLLGFSLYSPCWSGHSSRLCALPLETTSRRFLIKPEMLWTSLMQKQVGDEMQFGGYINLSSGNRNSWTDVTPCGVTEGWKGNWSLLALAFSVPRDWMSCFLPQKRNSLILMIILKAMLFASRILKPKTAMNSIFTFSILTTALKRRRGKKLWSWYYPHPPPSKKRRKIHTC